MKQGWRSKAFWMPIVSACLLLLAFPPFNLRFLVFVCLAPWLPSLATMTRREAWGSGWRFGLTYMLGQLFFLQMLTMTWTRSFGLSLVPWLVGGFLGSFYFSFLAIAIRRAPLWAAPLIWAGIEVVRSYFPVVAYPWGLIATPLWPYPAVIGLAWAVTIYGLSAWVVVINLAISTLVARRQRLSFALCGGFGLLLSVVIYMASAPGPGNHLVTAAQPGVDLAFGDPEVAAREADVRAQKLIDLAALGHSELVLLPEGIARLRSLLPGPIPFRVPPGIAVAFGAARGTDPVYQSVVTTTPKFAVADKTRLVIFGEFVPARKYLTFLSGFNLPSGDMQSGDAVSAIQAGPLKLGPIVCFESLFPDVSFRQAANGAELLGVVSDDDWFFGTPAPDQLKASCVFRAVETGLPTVRSASTGYSMIVNGRGDLLAEAPIRKTTLISARITAGPRLKPIFRVPFMILIVMSALGAAWFGRRPAKVQLDSTPEDARPIDHA